MALSDEDKKEITEIFKTVMDTSKCACGLSSDSQLEMGHLVGAVRDLGGGNLNNGIEVLRYAIKAVSKFQQFGGKVGSAVAILILVSVAGGLGHLIYVGFKEFIKK